MYVGGLSGVSFDTKTEIEQSEWVFRALGLAVFITTMDTVHMTYDRTPFPTRHLFIGKEDYPTVDVNIHSNAVGWVKHVGSIFPDAHNDKTTVRFDNLVSVMRNDALFTSCEWDTSVPVTNGQTYNLYKCMTLCDSGYHRWKETRLPMLVKDMSEVEDLVKVCYVLHNMCLQVCMYTYNPYLTALKLHTMFRMHV
jgi:hypothetical protein